MTLKSFGNKIRFLLRETLNEFISDDAMKFSASFSYKDAIIGAAFTASLFMVGKSVIGAYIGSSSTASIYGVAGSLIIILLWVYYSAIILYFGAEFTEVYASEFGDKITPNDYAVYIDRREKKSNLRLLMLICRIKNS